LAASSGPQDMAFGPLDTAKAKVLMAGPNQTVTNCYNLSSGLGKKIHTNSLLHFVC